MKPQTQLSGPRITPQSDLDRQALMQARQSVGAPISGRPRIGIPGMAGGPATSSMQSGKPIVPPAGSMIGQGVSPYSTSYEETRKEDGGNETLNPTVP